MHKLEVALRLLFFMQADLWSLGIILFELYVSKPPFFTNNVYTLIKQIINNRITYPLGMSADFRSFLEVCPNTALVMRHCYSSAHDGFSVCSDDLTHENYESK